MIKIAIVLDDPGRGGAYKVAKDIGEGLDKSLYSVQYYFLCKQPANPPEGLFLGEPKVTINYSIISYLRLAYFPKPHEKSFPPLNKALSEYQPDVIHFQTHAILLTLVQGVKKLKLDSLLFYTDHSQRLRQGELTYFKQYLMSKIYRRLFRFVRVVYVSNYAYQTAIDLGYGIKNKDIPISNSVDTQKFNPCKSSKLDDALKIVYLSRLHHAKGHHQLLNAWHQMPVKNNISLHFYGSEEDGGSVTSRIKKEDFPNPVFYEGITGSPESVLQNAHIGVFPSFREGLPLGLLEMMACGLPVVASDIPEIKSVVNNNKNGLLFACGNEDELADKLQKLVGDKLLRHQLGKEARKTVVTHYSEPISEKYSNLYRSVNTC